MTVSPDENATPDECTDAGPPGVNIRMLEGWLRATRPDLVGDGELRARLITGGLSNLTYLVSGGERDLVLRRPPLGHVLATAHDMKREYRVMSAVHGTPVPVPKTELFFEDDRGEAGVGTPFYLMDFVEGQTLSQRADNSTYSATALEGLSRDLGRTIARVHDIDWRAVGLDDFGRPDGFLARQLRRWETQLGRSRSRDLPGLDRLLADLQEKVPETTFVSLVHGDFRIDNTLVRSVAPDDAQVATVLDWEMSTIGDSLSDLGLFGVYWDLHSVEGSAATPLASPIDPSAGYSTFPTVLAHYSEARHLATAPDLSWYLAFASFKLAVILEGIHYRHAQGNTVGAGFDTVGSLVAPLADRGHDYLGAGIW